MNSEAERQFVEYEDDLAPEAVDDPTLTEADFDQQSVNPEAEKRLSAAVTRYLDAHPGASMGHAVAALRAATLARRGRFGPASLEEVIVFCEGGEMTAEGRGHMLNSIGIF
jgi:hypothetical protein